MVVFVGVASADETPTSAPAKPETLLAPAVVVAAGADAINPNAVTRLTAYNSGGTEKGTAFAVDDGRIGTVAHALRDARGIGLGEPGEPNQILAPLTGPTAIPSAVSASHDLASFLLPVDGSSLRIADEPARVDDHVVLAGFGEDERLQVAGGRVLYRGDGEPYGIPQPEVLVISASIVPGWSGGPVVDGFGDVVGVIIGTERTSGVTVAVPVEHLPTPSGPNPGGSDPLR